MNNPVIVRVVEQMETLPANLQQQVLEFVEALKASTQRGIPGSQLLRFAGFIPSDDLQRMKQAIAIGCEQVDLNEW
jgi:hypothetical protein